MEVGQEAVYNLVAVTGVEERVGHTLLRFQEPVGIGNGFDDAGAGSAHRYNAAAFALSLVNDVSIFSSELVMFTVHLVLRKVFHRNVLECTRAHMQRDFGNVHALRLQGIEHFFAKVQARRRGGHGARILCKNRLVSLLVIFVIGAVNVGRQRYMAFAVHDGFQFHGRYRKAEHAGTVFLDFFDNSLDAGNFKFATDLESLARTHLRLVAGRTVFSRNQSLHQERFHFATVHGVAVQAGRNHLGVVYHQAVARLKKVDNFRSLQNVAFTAILGAMQNTGLPLARRAAGNQFLREFKIIVRKIMRFHFRHPSQREPFSTSVLCLLSEKPALKCEHRSQRPPAKS